MSEVTQTASLTIDQDIMNQWNDLQDKKAAFEEAGKDTPSWRTSCLFGYNVKNLSDRVDIRQLTDERKLVWMYQWLIQNHESFEKASAELGSTVEYSWLNYNLGEWKHDFKLCMDRLKRAERKEELKAIEAILSEILTPAMITQMKLDRAKARLSKI